MVLVSGRLCVFKVMIWGDNKLQTRYPCSLFSERLIKHRLIQSSQSPRFLGLLLLGCPHFRSNKVVAPIALVVLLQTTAA